MIINYILLRLYFALISRAYFLRLFFCAYFSRLFFVLIFWSRPWRMGDGMDKK